MKKTPIPPPSDLPLSPLDRFFLDILREPHDWRAIAERCPVPLHTLRALIAKHLDAGTITADPTGKFRVAPAPIVVAIAPSHGGVR